MSVGSIGWLVGEILAASSPGLPGAREPTPQEGEWNGSLGSVAAFTGVLGVVFAVLALTLATVDRPGLEPPPFFLIAAVAFAFSWAGWNAGRRAPGVTRRRLGLARAGCRLARVAWILLTLAVTTRIWRAL